VFSFYSSFVGLIFSETLHSMVLVYITYYMIKANYLQSVCTALRNENSPTQIALIFSKKFSHSNRFNILQKISPACRTDAVLRKYGDTSARCTSFGPYFNSGNQNPFYIKLTKTYDYYRECLGKPVNSTTRPNRRPGCPGIRGSNRRSL
jgi:hypothetical protein